MLKITAVATMCVLAAPALAEPDIYIGFSYTGVVVGAPVLTYGTVTGYVDIYGSVPNGQPYSEAQFSSFADPLYPPIYGLGVGTDIHESDYNSVWTVANGALVDGTFNFIESDNSFGINMNFTYDPSTNYTSADFNIFEDGVYYYIASNDVSVSVPEPSSMLILGAGAAGLLLAYRIGKRQVFSSSPA